MPWSTFDELIVDEYEISIPTIAIASAVGTSTGASDSEK
jgi:hypothetical protein